MERTRQWPRPFVVVIAGGLILALSIGTRQSFGLYLAPMSQDLGWARETFALAIALQNIVWGLAQPLFGFWADRWGTGRVVAGSGLGYALGLYLMSQTEGAAGFHWSGCLKPHRKSSRCSCKTKGVYHRYLTSRDSAAGPECLPRSRAARRVIWTCPSTPDCSNSRLYTCRRADHA